jgi:O-antigen/teichoic acid export membrane protein
VTSLKDQVNKLIGRFTGNPLMQRVIKNSGYLFSATGISAGLGMLQGIIVIRVVGITDYGILGTIIMFTSVINNLVSFRMGELVVRFVGHFSETDERQQAAAVFKAAALAEMSASVIAFLLLVMLAPLAAEYLAKDPATQSWFVIYGLVILVNLISESSTGLLQIFDHFRDIALYNLVQSIVTIVIILLVYVLGGGIFAILIAYLAGKTVSSLALTFDALVQAGRRWGAGWWRSPIHLLKPRARELTAFAFNTNVSGSISLLTKDSELLWVSFFRGPTEAGYYRVALSLANLVQMPVNPLPQATYPELARQVVRKEWASFRELIRQGSMLAGSYTLLVSIFLTVFGQALIALLYTPQAAPAYPALVILMVGLLFANTFYWRRIALLALGRPDFSTKLNLVLAGLKVGGTVLLVPVYGYLASAALLSGFYAVVSLVSTWKVRGLLYQHQTAELAAVSASHSQGISD